MGDFTCMSPRATLCVLGLKIQEMNIWSLIEEQVKIRQKTVNHRPTDKMMDAFINILAGGHGLVEINTRVRPDRALQLAFGRTGCAEQSTVSETFDACTGQNVEAMREVLHQTYRQFSRGYSHNYQEQWQLLDADLTGMLAGRQGEGVEKGFFNQQGSRRGRKLGRVMATAYDEIVCERLYPGRVTLEQRLQELVVEAEAVLDLKEEQRQQTVIRVDGGGGRDADINWMLKRGYQIVAKVKNWQRTLKLARSVKQWYDDPEFPGRQLGWVGEPHTYVRATRQLATRYWKKGKYRYRVLVFTLNDERLAWVANQPTVRENMPKDNRLLAVYAYDRRGGGIETTFKNSKWGLGITKRNKRRFSAQEMLAFLAQLAYNILTWMRHDMTKEDTTLAGYGPLRLIRDLFNVTGILQFDGQNQIRSITLNSHHPLASSFVRAWQPFCIRNGMYLILAKI